MDFSRTLSGITMSGSPPSGREWARLLKPLRAVRRPSAGGGRGRTLSRRRPSPRVSFPGAIRRVSRALAPGLVWVGAGIAVVLLLLSLAANRLRGVPFDPASLPGVFSPLVLAPLPP